ncbi:MAG: sulfite exporter TauE/SafE family protein [Candidatus Dormibacteria bacterium]
MLLVLAGVLAGVVGSAGGITSLISYPALLAVGLSPLAATLTNSVSLVASWPGSGWGSRPELRGQSGWLWRWSLLAGSGGVIGAALLLVTREGIFGRVVPFLIGLAAVALLLQPRLARWRGLAGDSGRRRLLASGLFGTSVYNGYFGAGSGVMVLTLMLLTVDSRYPVANALKNMLVGVATLVAAIAFAFSARVAWWAVAPLALGLLGGSYLGPKVARSVPQTPLRVLVALGGLALAVHLWLIAS